MLPIVTGPFFSMLYIQVFGLLFQNLWYTDAKLQWRKVPRFSLITRRVSQVLSYQACKRGIISNLQIMTGHELSDKRSNG